MPMRFGTFSIVARCRKTGDFGVASSTAVPCVGALLPFAEEGVGAIATQAWVNINLGYQGLELMKHGLPVKAALEALLAEDEGRVKRQVIGVDSKSTFGFTGSECDDAKGHVLGDDFAIAGSMLVDRNVIEAMADYFRKSRGELASRLLSAVEVGQTTGGDSRGKASAALLVASAKPKLYHNIRVDLHTDPVRELRRIYEKCVELEEEYRDDAGNNDLRRRIARVQK
jgi:uncharacterized Ntn-hydrolase superfamily protein